MLPWAEDRTRMRNGNALANLALTRTINLRLLATIVSGGMKAVQTWRFEIPFSSAADLLRSSA